MSSLYSNKINRRLKALSRASHHIEMKHKPVSKKAQPALYILREIHRKMKKLSKAADYLEVKQMFASPRKTRRARENLRKINLKIKVPSKAAYHWRKQVVAWTKLQRQKKIIYRGWLQEFYKLCAEIRVMTWKDIIHYTSRQNQRPPANAQSHHTLSARKTHYHA
jgi:hypothetical protein